MAARRTTTKNTMSTALVQIAALQKTHGLRRAQWLLTFLASWTLATRRNGWEPLAGAEHYARLAGLGRAKGYRDLQRWRDMFPAEPDPTSRVLTYRAAVEKLEQQMGQEPTVGDIWATIAPLPI